MFGECFPSGRVPCLHRKSHGEMCVYVCVFSNFLSFYFFGGGRVAPGLELRASDLLGRNSYF
jgi:hypothetical protein